MLRLSEKVGVSVVLLFARLAVGCSAEPSQSTALSDAGQDVATDATLPEADIAAKDAGPTMVCGMVQESGDACQACVVQACCSEAEACEDDPTCQAYMDCESDCEDADEGCFDACILANASGYPEAQVLEACVAHQCNEPCERLPEDQCGGALSDETCQACAEQSAPRVLCKHGQRMPRHVQERQSGGGGQVRRRVRLSHECVPGGVRELLSTLKACDPSQICGLKLPDLEAVRSRSVDWCPANS